MVDAQRQDLTWSPTRNSSTRVGRLISDFANEPHVSRLVSNAEILENEAGLDVASYTDDSEFAIVFVNLRNPTLIITQPTSQMKMSF